MEDAKTCIICGKEFSPYVRHCHGLQLSKTKTTCSDACRAVANAQLKRERYQDRKEKAQAIPPAYTEWIGKQLIDYLGAR